MGSELSPVTVSPRPSRLLALTLGGLQLITGLVLTFAPMPLVVKLILSLALAVQILASIHGRASRQPRRLRIDSGHGVRLVYADGRVLETQLTGDTVVTPYGLFLRFQGDSGWRRTSLLLAADSLSGDEMRRLRVLLRFGGPDRNRSQKGA